ncbi:MAG: UbiA family prenyltransferase [Alphaproteobacteria bacterium]|nr:UbiA family prenyltransferase [Alphaproteobacteria bacterium]
MDRTPDPDKLPLCVDLDGTLVATDTLWEGLLGIILRNPLMVFAAIGWLMRGKAALKTAVAEQSDRDPATWPYRPEVLEFLENERRTGRTIILATGAPKKVAHGVAGHLGIFHAVLHSSDTINLTASRKRDVLVQKFGVGGFDYVGDSSDDVAVFEAANEAIVVAPDRAANRWQRNHDAKCLVKPKGGLRSVLKGIRVHQWLKNSLLAVPLILNHEVFNVVMVLTVVAAFVSFSFAASFVYVLNDLADLENDRRHVRKRLRPFASGQLSIPFGLFLGASLLIVSLGIALLLPPLFLGVLLLYIAATTAYSFVLKSKLLVDVFALAGLFTLRIIAGAAAASVELSFWLLAFSIFFFLSLALVKRYVELQELAGDEGSKQLGRGYYAVDFEMIGQAGISSAFGSALVLALYVHSDEVSEMYASPALLWPLCPLILYMLLRIWMLARRGQMEDDPVVFLISDWRSQLVTVVGAVLVLFGAVVSL